MNIFGLNFILDRIISIVTWFRLMMEETLLEEIVHHTANILPAVAKCLPDQSKTITGFVENLKKRKPEIAKGLVVASVICK